MGEINFTAANRPLPANPKDESGLSAADIKDNAIAKLFTAGSATDAPALRAGLELAPSAQDAIKLPPAESLQSSGPQAGPDFVAERKELMENFSAHGQAAQKDKALEWQKDVERKILGGDLSEDEVARTYEQINKLLTTSSPYLTDIERVNVAAEMLYHTSTIRPDQGMHGTCNVSVLENIAFSKNPSQAAEMITSAALTGNWQSSDGQTITIPEGSLKPGLDEQEFPPKDLFRSHASQIFQVVALNDVGQHEKEPLQFEQKETGIGSLFHLLGEAILPWSEYWMGNGSDVWKHADGHETEFDGLSCRQITDESHRLFGDKYDLIAFESPYEKLSHPFTVDPADYKNAKLVKSEDDLRQRLSQIKSADHLPVIVAVNGDNNHIQRDIDTADKVFGFIRDIVRPVKSLHEYIDERLGIANHVVTITKYDPARDSVYVSNSWGKEEDGWLTLDDLWQSM